MEEQIKEMLIRHEGLVCNVYKCTANPPRDTIGVGRNLNDVGISEEEALYLLDNDIKRVHEELDKSWGVWRTFPYVQARMVCIDCCFQMGITGWMGFRRTRALMEMGCWLEASEEILDSKYYSQTPNRALYNSRQLALCHQKAMSNKIKRSV